MNSDNVGTAAIRGTVAGLLATALMSALMMVGKRFGLVGGVPPEKITAKLLNKGGIRRSSKQQDALATAAHFAFGAAGGTMFGPISRRVPIPRVPLGVAYGTAIWAVSYKGWVPWLRVMPPAERDRRDRQAVMLAGHIVYGAALGLLMGRKPEKPPESAADDDDRFTERAR
jgi:hypothetical protein